MMWISPLVAATFGVVMVAPPTAVFCHNKHIQLNLDIIVRTLMEKVCITE